MRMKIVCPLACISAFFWLVSCNQQRQNVVNQPATPVVKPNPTQVAPPKVDKPRKSDKVNKPSKPVRTPEPVKPVVPAVVEPPVVVPAEPVVEPAPSIDIPVRPKPLGKRVSHVPMKGKYVALTFDDGPHPSLTPAALDILNRHGAKGTFFMLGQNANRYKSIVARAAAEGHELGVHTWSHIKMNSCSRAKVDNEVGRTQRILTEAAGKAPRVMRPPYGATNKTLVDHMYDRYGMASILWDVDTLDWRKPGVSKVINTAVNKARPGSIILVHDIHASTLAALEGIVTGLQARGFQLVTVSELMMLGKREAAAAEAAALPQSELPVLPEPPAAAAPEQPGEAPPVTSEPAATPAVAPVVPVPQVVVPDTAQPDAVSGDVQAPALNSEIFNQL